MDKPRRWIGGTMLAALALAGAVFPLTADVLSPPMTDEQLLALVDPKQPTDYSQLRATLTPASKIFMAGQPVWVDFAVQNLSDKPILVRVPFQSANPDKLNAKHMAPVAGLPLEHVFSGKPRVEGPGRKALIINPFNDPISELDGDVVVKPAAAVEPIVLRPQGRVGLRLDLSKYYPSLTKPGRFLVQWRAYGDALRSLTTELRIMPEEHAIIETDKGNIELMFFYDKAPNHVENFLDLSRRGFYDGTLFHRIIDGFMIQGGDPQTTDESKSGQWGTGRGPRTLKQEFNDVSHEPGVLSAARGPDVNSASCQFFIVTGDARFLDGQYTAFGRCVDAASRDVAMKLSKVKTHKGGRNDPLNDRPLEPVKIKKIRVVPASPATQPATQPE